MDVLKNWGLIVSTALLCASFADMLTPNGAVKKSVRLCIVLFFCVALLSPLLKEDVLLSANVILQEERPASPEEEKYQQEINSALVESACSVLSSTLQTEIDYRTGVPITVTHLEGHISEDGSFRADRAIISISEDDYHKKDVIKKILQSQLGEAEISFLSGS